MSAWLIALTPGARRSVVGHQASASTPAGERLFDPGWPVELQSPGTGGGRQWARPLAGGSRWQSVLPGTAVAAVGVLPMGQLNRPGASARGVTLIEVLVAMFVVAVAILGLVGLQMVSLQNNRTALLRGEAVRLASDIVERIRANPDSGDASLAMGDGPPSSPDCLQAVCTADQMAALDRAQWKCSLGAWDETSGCQRLGITGALPGGDGSIDVAGRVVTIRVQWQDPAAQCQQAADDPALCFIDLQMIR